MKSRILLATVAIFFLLTSFASAQVFTWDFLNSTGDTSGGLGAVYLDTTGAYDILAIDGFGLAPSENFDLNTAAPLGLGSGFGGPLSVDNTVNPAVPDQLGFFIDSFLGVFGISSGLHIDWTVTSLDAVTGGLISFSVWDAPGLSVDGTMNGLYVQSITANVVPEPSTMILLGAGLVGLVAYRRKVRA